LLHADGAFSGGADGQNNNTFLDSSDNSFTITRYGNTSQGTFGPFSQPDGAWSNYFVAESISFADNAAFTLGTSDFTAECWVYSDIAGVTRYIAGQADSTGATASGSFALVRESTNKVRGSVSIGSTPYSAISTNNLPINEWVHVALVRDGNTTRLYINGVQDATADVTGLTVNDSSNALSVGRAGEYTPNPWNGYISNFRLVVGTCLYPDGITFTPPTGALTAISGTALLTCQSNRFVDNSSNGFAITVNGTPKASPFSPFLPSGTYAPNVSGGSGFFDGTGDFLTAPGGDPLTFGTGDFTIEFWMYSSELTTSTIDPNFFDFRPTNVINGYLTIFYDSSASNLVFYFNAAIRINGGPLNENTWNHIAVCRSSGSTRMFVNGSQVGSTYADTNNYLCGTNRPTIGAQGYNTTNVDRQLNGYMAGIRMLKGTALYTADFTPPTSPPTNITNTSLLLNFTNAGIYDNTGKAIIQTVADAQVDTTIKKYGEGSIQLDGTGDYLAMNTHQAESFIFGTGDFTIEFWYYVSGGLGNAVALFDMRPSGGQGAYPCVFLSTSSPTFHIYYFVTNSARIIGTATTALNTWYHVAVCRSGGSTRMFKDGVQDGSTYSDSNNYINAAGRPFIGGNANAVGANTLQGYIDDFRITKGIARYTTTFTPPPRAFPNK
jgi:hypothetical protein